MTASITSHQSISGEVFGHSVVSYTDPSAIGQFVLTLSHPTRQRNILILILPIMAPGAVVFC